LLPHLPSARHNVVPEAPITAAQSTNPADMTIALRIVRDKEQQQWKQQQ